MRTVIFAQQNLTVKFSDVFFEISSNSLFFGIPRSVADNKHCLFECVLSVIEPTMQKAEEGTACPREIAIIGGGAAGFFAAITAAEANPEAQVTIYEKGHDFLKKVKVSGGGRCNVTHDCFDPEDLATRYPRGS